MASASGNVADLYKAFPLSAQTNHIRVLNVKAASRFQPNGGDISVDFRVVELNGHNPFSALSYVWGSLSEKPKTILCGNTAIQVTENCYSAIWHLRKRLGEFTIWIDAICINQESVREKEEQIPRMPEVYRTAQQVFIWLGSTTIGKARAMKYLRNAGLINCFFTGGDPNSSLLQSPQTSRACWSIYLARWSFRKHQNPFLTRNFSWFWRAPILWQLRKLLTATSATYYDLHELLTIEWVQRIWTYQEVILASKPVVVCGLDHLDWSRFALAIVFLGCLRPEQTLDDLLRESQKRGTGIDVLIFSSISTWKKIALIRESLQESPSQTLLDASGDEPGKLKQYEYFVNDVAYQHARVKKWARPIFGLALLISLALSILIPCLNARPTLHEVTTFDPLKSACLINCQKFHGGDCFKMCKAPNGTATSQTTVASTSWISGFLPWFTLPGLFVMALLLIVEAQLPPNMPFPRHKFDERNPRDVFNVDTDLLDGICARKATNPLDMAYGIQAVIEGVLGVTLPAPDYGREKTDVHQELSIHLIEANRSLQLLVPAAVEHVPEGSSWIPHWGSDFPDYWLHPFQRSSITYSASDSSTMEWEHLRLLRYRGINDRLRVRGYHIGTIGGLSSFFSTSNPYQYSHQPEHLSNLDLMIKLFKKHAGAPELAGYLCNRSNFPSLPIDILSPQLWNYIRFLAGYYKLGSKKVLEDLLLKKREWHDLSSLLRLWFPRAKFNAKEILYTHTFVCNSLSETNRFVFETTTGQELGFCSAKAQMGDKIILVQSVRLPLVVRENIHGDFELISPAIMMDVMNGELWRGLRHNEGEPEDIVLT